MGACSGMQRPATIALTGGPCGGKTSLLEELRSRESLAGHKLLFVPEAATILLNGGHDFLPNVRAFQTEVMRLQLKLEDEARERAHAAGAPCAIVCDRGTLDGSAYCSPQMFTEIAAGFGQTRETLARRYDLVLHLVSAAVEAPEAYTTANNAVRREKNLEAAITQENLTRAAWAEHPNRIMVGSATGFADKLDTAIQAIHRFLRE